MNRGDAAATTWTVRGDGVGRRYYAAPPSLTVPHTAATTPNAAFPLGDATCYVTLPDGTFAARIRRIAAAPRPRSV